jgi:hypothetical protein
MAGPVGGSHCRVGSQGVVRESFFDADGCFGHHYKKRKEKKRCWLYIFLSKLAFFLGRAVMGINLFTNYLLGRCLFLFIKSIIPN